MAEPKILIIDDDEVATEILQIFIKEHYPSAKVEWCWNGFEALVKVEEIGPDVIFLDYMMPKVDGMEFLKALQSCGPCDHYRIVVISAFVDDEKEKEFRQLGADEVLPKPVNIEQVEDVLKKYL